MQVAFINAINASCLHKYKLAGGWWGGVVFRRSKSASRGMVVWKVCRFGTFATGYYLQGGFLKGTTPLDDFRKKYICAFLPMELRTYARAKTPKPLELRRIFSFFFQVWKHGMLFFCARGIILRSGDGHLFDKAAFRTFWATD